MSTEIIASNNKNDIDDNTEQNVISTKQEEEQQQTSEVDDLNFIKQFISEKQDRIRFKHELKEKNILSESKRPEDYQLEKLDSSIKKITSFIKRLKNLTESQKDSLSKDLVQLNLTKYISEVAAAFTEVKLKMNDINCALHLCSLMHQYYNDFSKVLFECWQKILNIKKDDKVQNPSKLRVDLRFFAELITIGVLPEKESLSLLGNQLTVLTIYDKEHINLSIINSFCKHCGEDFADLTPIKILQLSEKYSIEIPRSNLYSSDRQKAVKKLFKEYYLTLCQHLINDHKEIQKLERQNRKAFQTKGELSADKKEKCDQALIAYQKLLANTESLADLLGEQIPELPVDEFVKKEEDTINIDIYLPGRSDDFDSSTSPWEDEETRQFYECIPDLKALVPGILYKDSEKAVGIAQPLDATNQIEELKESDIETIEKEVEQAAKETEASTTTENDNNNNNNNNKKTDEIIEIEDGDTALSAAEVAKLQETEEIAEEEVGSATIKILMDAFIAQLPNCVNRELIDKAAKDFCMNLNTKNNRKRLVSALFQVQRTRLDLLPFYSRLVAILNPCMPEVANDLAFLLKNDFRFHIKKKDQINIESKIKNVRFIGEMVKFKMFSKVEALNCLKSLLGDLKHHNIEMTCNLLETCGRYLYRNSETHQRLKLYLEILMRKKQISAMDNRYTIMIENSFYYCNPPENKQIEKKIRIPIHEYIKKLLYKDLNKINVEKILRQLRKINWKDEDLFGYTVKSLIAAWNVRYNSIHCLANLVSGLASYYEEIGIQVVDGVIEDIRLGLEVNLPKFNQRRLSMVKYLGELYNYRMVESAIIFKTLYTIITYAVTLDVNMLNELDPPDNYFRIRLIYTLLDTCGQYFDHGTSKKKLDCFLLYFQRYFLFKKEICLLDDGRQFPIDVEYVYTEIINALRPNFKFAKSYQQAIDLVNDLEKEYRDNLIKTMQKEKQKNEELEAIGEEEEGEEEEDDEGETDEDDTNNNNNNNNNDIDSDCYNQNDDDNIRNSYSHDFDGEGENDEINGKKRKDSNSVNNNNPKNTKNNANGNQSSDDNEVVGELSDKEDIVVQARPSAKQVTKEDDDFIKAFESLMTDNIVQRSKELFKTPIVDIALPMHLKKLKNQAFANDDIEDDNNKQESQLNTTGTTITNTIDNNNSNNKNSGSFNFIVMVKKNNKPQFHNLEVPVTSEFATQFRAREQAEKIEKEKLKQLTLNINQRIEQEELQEMMLANNVSKQIASANTNRERKQKYNHPKGAPDADLIFGIRRQTGGSGVGVSNEIQGTNLNKFDDGKYNKYS